VSAAAGAPPAPRLLIAAHALLALGLLRDPAPLLARLGETPPQAGARWFTRILGARHLLEAVALALRRGRGPIYAAAGVDAAHAGTMLLLAGRSPRHRRAALANASTAAALGMCVARRGRRTRP
jgi:hypothetical protein